VRNRVNHESGNAIWREAAIVVKHKKGKTHVLQNLLQLDPGELLRILLPRKTTKSKVSFNNALDPNFYFSIYKLSLHGGIGAIIESQFSDNQDKNLLYKKISIMMRNELLGKRNRRIPNYTVQYYSPFC
jgi:hypothetical protein